MTISQQTYDIRIEGPNKHLLRTTEEQIDILTLRHLKTWQHSNR